MKKIILILTLVFFIIGVNYLSAGPPPYHGGYYGHGYRGGYYGHGYHGNPYWWGPALGFGVGLGLGVLLAPPTYYAPSPPVIIQQVPPPVYVQPEQNYWFYCQNPQGYYPNVNSCPGGWMKVVPSVPK